MAIIQTERNRVVAHDPQPGDVFVRASLLVPGATPGTQTPRHLRYQPITDYQSLVDWAVSMADKIAYPIHVLPLSFRDMLVPGRFQPFADALAGMDDQQRGELRRLVVTTAAEVMRDCDDPDIRADMFDVLRKLKVIRHES